MGLQNHRYFKCTMDIRDSTTYTRTQILPPVAFAKASKRKAARDEEYRSSRSRSRPRISPPVKAVKKEEVDESFNHLPIARPRLLKPSAINEPDVCCTGLKHVFTVVDLTSVPPTTELCEKADSSIIHLPELDL